jgi:hypothetical protein
MAKAALEQGPDNLIAAENNIGPKTLRRHVVRDDTMSRQWMSSNSLNAMTELFNAVAFSKKTLTGVRDGN